MKRFISTVLATFLTLSAVSANAAAVAAADAGMVQTATFAGELAAFDQAFLKAVHLTDIGSSNILWVLGGGLVALSLVARRRSR